MAATKSSQNKKLVYILGCGRSGTTILGFVLGNGAKCLDLGEIKHFLRRKGEPSEFPDDTPTGEFWKSVRTGVQRAIPNVFCDKYIKRTASIDSYRTFVRLYMGLLPGQEKQAYGHYLNTLFQNIVANSMDNEFYVDTSKSPVTALSYQLFLKDIDIYYLHLVRSPVGVVESFGARDRGPGRRGFLWTNLYYFVVNLSCFLIRLRIPRSRYLKIRYEDLVQDPRRVLGRISSLTGLDLHCALDKIDNGEPLKKGYVFNGNRVRLKTRVVLELVNKTYRNSLGNRITRLMNSFWY
jgi:hypothetical protein